MAFFFFFNDRQPIGIKLLSDADLGISDTTHQTHIGLYKEVLQYLDNEVITSAMLIYKEHCEILDCYFDRIENPDGSFRSPKIRMGINDNSVTSKIRKIASERPWNKWYLVWSALDNGNLVFWLIESESVDYEWIKDLINAGIRVVYEKDVRYSSLRDVFINRANELSLSIQKDLEIVVQTGLTRKYYKKVDLEKAKKRIIETGKRGEVLVDEYLKKLVYGRSIRSYEWVNKSCESGLPYDFLIKTQTSLPLYIDVKSTSYDFNQRIIFSNQEIGFVKHYCNNNTYSVYRIFDLTDNGASLKICHNCMSYMENMEQQISNFTSSIECYDTVLMNMGLAVEPTKCFSLVEPTILI